MSDTLAAAKASTCRCRGRVEMPAGAGRFPTHFVESGVALGGGG
jgi:hypothetical protein